ncbi:hypothetical protein NE865_13089 [Phthorimaea operculella]|nr:hypothetical protein NE865_13089 [Phthorimaea operculella]
MRWFPRKIRQSYADILVFETRLAQENEKEQHSDIPTTLTRSKADVPEPDERSSAASANDLVLDKLTQIFSYLRHGRHRKMKKNKIQNIIQKRKQPAHSEEPGFKTPKY